MVNGSSAAATKAVRLHRSGLSMAPFCSIYVWMCALLRVMVESASAGNPHIIYAGISYTYKPDVVMLLHSQPRVNAKGASIADFHSLSQFSNSLSCFW
ncbi:unnamed protein product [Soboliphyme baturini]|uniref:Secreted protein n=1 Tax=Soboliphyme baturini TaxID=241478 RepID=A0A183IC26_9BILA|nr:unnamed protein product [Soboliphyme baturini]